MLYKYLNMSKLSDTGLILYIIGTFLMVLPVILFYEISPILFVIILINGLILICIASIIGIITKDEYHTLTLKNGFPLKLDHLIIFICAMTIMMTFCLSADINIYKYTGKFTYFTIFFPLIMIFFAILTNFFKKYFNNLKIKKPN